MSTPNQRDIILLFSTRIIRLFCYGFLSVVLALYLSEAGLTEEFLSKLYAPIGLPLGGRSPEEIAIAILAQVVAARNRGSAGAAAPPTR